VNLGNLGRVSFVGAGPGAADLITVRGARRIAEADIVVWAASLVDPECIREHARPDAELIDSSLITHEDVLEVYRRAMREHKRVARVHSGDPSLWGAVQEQYDACQRLGIEVEIVPGVSAFSAAAAVVGRELTIPEVSQSVILTRLEGGKTPMPDGEQIREFARHGTTMAIFLSAARSGQLVEELLAGGYTEDTPVVVAYKATWPDELILHTTIGELVEQVKQHKLWRHTLFLVGRALRGGGTRSHLYNAGHFHTYRKADPVARRALRAGRVDGQAEALGTGDQADAADSAESAESSAASSTGKSRAGWPLHTSRSGWVAARIANGWSPTQKRADRPDAEQLAGASQPASAAAWSAVRGWQETARSAGRPNSRTRPVGEVRALRTALDQGTLALDGEAESAATSTAPAISVTSATSADPAVAADPTLSVDSTGSVASTASTGSAVEAGEPAPAGSAPVAKPAITGSVPAEPVPSAPEPTSPLPTEPTSPEPNQPGSPEPGRPGEPEPLAPTSPEPQPPVQPEPAQPAAPESENSTARANTRSTSAKAGAKSNSRSAGQRKQTGRKPAGKGAAQNRRSSGNSSGGSGGGSGGKTG
jgi:precorrin-4 C11-methyltransferase